MIANPCRPSTVSILVARSKKIGDSRADRAADPGLPRPLLLGSGRVRAATAITAMALAAGCASGADSRVPAARSRPAQASSTATPNGPPTARPGRWISLPSRGFAVQRHNHVVLYSLRGIQLRRLPHTSILQTAHGSPALQDSHGRRLLLRRGPAAFSGDVTVTPAVEAGGPHCEGSLSRAGQVRVCALPLRHAAFHTRLSVVSSRQVRRLPSHPPGAVVGHWRYGDLSRDGRYVLMAWSGECESQSAYLVDLASGSVRPVDGAASPVEMVALGWLANRTAAVFYPSAGCGRTVPVAGIYRVSLKGKPRQLIVAAGDNAVMWS